MRERHTVPFGLVLPACACLHSSMSRIMDLGPCKAITSLAGSGGSGNGSGGSGSGDTPAGSAPEATVASAGEQDGGAEVADEGDEADKETVDLDQMDWTDRGWKWAAKSRGTQVDSI